MKRLPFFVIVGALVAFALYLLPKLFYVMLTILMAGVIPGTSFSISPVVMFLGATIGGAFLLHRLQLLNFKSEDGQVEVKATKSGELVKKTVKTVRRFIQSLLTK